jgi:choline-sulfatase
LQSHKDRPFFLTVSFTEPHSPFHYPVEFRGRHDPAKFRVPRVGPEDAAQVPQVFRGLTDRDKQGIQAAYYTSVEFMDRNVGLVLQALRDLGLEETTLVIYLSDHGYLLGHHGRFEKHCLFEEAVRAPLLMRLPQAIRAATATEALVELIDLAPTVLEACKVEVPKKVQGKSLLGLATGKAVRHRDVVFVEYAENEAALVRTPRWSFQYGTGKRRRQDGYDTGLPLPGRTVKLYDLDKDPGQFTNLAGRPEHARLVAELTERLADHLRRTARQPELVPRGGDLHAVLEHCLQPRDVGAEGKGMGR